MKGFIPPTVQSKFGLTSLVLLVSLIFAGFFHNHALAYDEAAMVAEQLDCKLCQVQVELPKQKVALVGINIGCFYLDAEQQTKEPVIKPQRNAFQQRAPPYC
ncbi:hypothetical protein [Thalassotalea ganghwensis]